jgi:hypothetical protein
MKKEGRSNLKRATVLSTILLMTLTAEANGHKNILEIETSGEARVGAVEIKDESDHKRSTISLGGSVSLKTKPLYGLSTGMTFYTTNALFGKKDEGMFLNSENESYSIVGEAYLQGSFNKTEVKVGRQRIETPFINSDDIGMIANTVEGYTLFNQSLNDTTVMLGSINHWAGIDAPKPEKFTKLQESDPVMLAGLMYEGIENTTLQAWYYKLEEHDWRYVEVSYEGEGWTLAGQYTNQGEGNSLYGFDGSFSVGNVMLHTAFNEARGMVSNGFGGGPFFTSSEDHTVHETVNNKAKLMGVEYTFKDATLALTHVDFTKSEDETDYLFSYILNENLMTEFIYSDMNHDGKMSRFFVKYSF